MVNTKGDAEQCYLMPENVGYGVLDSLHKNSYWKIIDAWMQGKLGRTSISKYKKVWATYTIY